MLLRGLMAGAVLISGAAGLAQSVQPCSNANLGAVSGLKPSTDNQKLFANGKTIFKLLDAGTEKSKMIIQISSPPFKEDGTKTCQVIAFTAEEGFDKILLDQLDALYDPSIGLLFDIPVSTPETPDKWTLLQINLNQATGKLDADFMGYIGVN